MNQKKETQDKLKQEQESNSKLKNRILKLKLEIEMSQEDARAYKKSAEDADEEVYRLEKKYLEL